jgi:hypothetical protein
MRCRRSAAGKLPDLAADRKPLAGYVEPFTLHRKPIARYAESFAITGLFTPSLGVAEPGVLAGTGQLEEHAGNVDPPNVFHGHCPGQRQRVGGGRFDGRE